PVRARRCFRCGGWGRGSRAILSRGVGVPRAGWDGNLVARSAWHRARASPSPSDPLHDVQAQVLQIEVAGDAAGDLVVDQLTPPEIGDRLPLGVEQLAPQALVLLRLLLDRAVALRVEPRPEPVDAKAVQPSHALDGVRVRPAFVDQL